MMFSRCCLLASSSAVHSSAVSGGSSAFIAQIRILRVQPANSVPCRLFLMCKQPPELRQAILGPSNKRFYSSSLPSPTTNGNGSNGTSRRWSRRLVMSKDLHERKLRLIQEQSEEQIPRGLLHKLHYFFKRYWYIAIPVHTAVCAAWFVGLYFAVQSGVDIVALLEQLHIPDSWVNKVREVPPTAGYAVAALILYKIATPLRYACSIMGIRFTYNALRRVGKLRTTRELEYAMRRRLERGIHRINNRRSAGKVLQQQARAQHEHKPTGARRHLSSASIGSKEKNSGG